VRAAKIDLLHFLLHFKSFSLHREFTVPSSHASLSNFPNSSVVQDNTSKPQETLQDIPTFFTSKTSSNVSDVTCNSQTKPVPRLFYHTAKWLKENFEPKEGSNVSRLLLYSHYRKYCQSIGLVTPSAATFGKVIRSIFKGIGTRRLGKRYLKLINNQ
jgi:hypothetical protein